MSKKVSDSLDTWDIHLNQVPAGIRFTIIESTKFSPLLPLYNCDPVLLIENILKPRRRYLGEKPDTIALEQQQKSFLIVHQNL